jgi:hypothetical protein
MPSLATPPLTSSLLEPIISRAERLPVVPAGAMKSSPSLRPGVAMMEAAATGNIEACGIRDAWRFSEPVTIVTREEYALMVHKGSVVFHG